MENIINEIRIATNVAQELVVISNIEVSERLFHRLKTAEKAELKRVQQHIPLVCGLTSTVHPNGDTKTSNLAIRVPEGHNEINEIAELAAAVKTVHEMLLENLSQDEYLDNINKDLKKFYE